MEIIAVHSDPESLEQLTACLEPAIAPCRVVPFADPMLAVKHLAGSGKNVNFIVAALLMRHLDGLGLIKLVRELLPGVPVLIVGREACGELEALVRANGASGYLSQPLSEETLRAAVQEFAVMSS